MSKKDKAATVKPEEQMTAEETVTEKIAEEKAEAEAPKEEKAEVKPNLMYVGDTIPGVVRHSTVYAEGILTPAIDKCIEEFPAMAKLFVPVDDITEALKKVKEKYSPLFVVNREAVIKFTRRK